MGLSVQVGVLADLLENDPESLDWLRQGFRRKQGSGGARHSIPLRATIASPSSRPPRRYSAEAGWV
jgi:hypothetical protein